MSTDRAEEAQRAGRGGLAVLTAKVFFIATGFVQQPLLLLAIGSADYGGLSRVLAVSNVFNNVVVSGSTQGVSRTVASAGASERQALRATLRVHLVIAIVGASLLALAAPIVAWFQHAGEVLVPIVVMASVLGIYGVYAPLIGYLNGRAQFTRQASLDIAAATLRTTALLGLGWLFAHHAGAFAATLGTSPGVLGATLGASVAALGVFMLALRWTGTGSPGSGAGVPSVKAYLALVAPIMLAQLFTNGLMQADIILVGRYLSLSAVAGGVADPSKAANEWVAVYRACQLFAFLPYQMLFSVTQVLFPMLAKARVEDGPERVAELVRRGCRIGAIVCGMLVCVVLALPGSLLAFAYGSAVAAQGAGVLRILGLGQAAFAMLGLSTTVLVSLGRERAAMSVTALALALLAGSVALIAPGAEFGNAQLVATAVAASCALAAALVVGAVTVKRISGGFVPPMTALRVGACVAAAFAVGRIAPTLGKLVTPIAAAAVVLAYLAALVVTRELGKDDLALVLSLAKRRKG
jgi:stage V sporulation protein B